MTTPAREQLADYGWIILPVIFRRPCTMRKDNDQIVFFQVPVNHDVGGDDTDADRWSQFRAWGAATWKVR